MILNTDIWKHLRRVAMTAIGMSIAAAAFAQYTVSGIVRDADTKEPVEYCTVSIAGTLHATSTAANGYYELVLKEGLQNFEIVATHISYEVTRSASLSFTKNKLRHDILLTASEGALPTVVITTAPDTVWGSEELNVADYAFVPQGILLLTYAHEERWKRQEEAQTTLYHGCQLIWIDSTGAELKRLAVDGLCKGFYLNYLDEVFLQCRHTTYLVQCTEGNITLMPFDADDFEQYIAPVVDTVGSVVYYSNYNANYPAFEYMAFNRDDSTYHTLRYLVDEELMQRFRAQYRDLGPREKLEAFRMEIETGIDREVFGAYMTGFPATPYYQPLNVPMLMAGDTLVIFDHVHDKLLRYANYDEPLDSVLINYHHAQRGYKWGQAVVKDDATQRIYTWYEKAGACYLKHIDVRTGLASQISRLSYRYTDKIRVHNHAVYYIYRPFESSQNRFLYSEKLSEE